MVVTACGKSDSKKETVKKTGNEVVSNSESEDESNSESDTKDEGDKKGKDEDTSYVEYYYSKVNYTLPMMHTYKETFCNINDNSEMYIVMNQMEGIVENGVYIDERVVDLDKILEENKQHLSFYNGVAHIEDKEYVIDYSEEYTTKTGIKGIKYEGHLVNDTTSYYFYSFVFNTDKNSYQYIGFSSDQIVGYGEEEFNLEEITKKIKTTMEKSIDTIWIEE